MSHAHLMANLDKVAVIKQIPAAVLAAV